jgi:hypothetical protein
MSLFVEQGVRWMHGDMEEAMFKRCVGTATEKELEMTAAYTPSDAVELLMWVAVRNSDLDELKEMQCLRIVQWFIGAGANVQSTTPHCECYRSILNILLFPKLDVKALVHLFELLRGMRVSFAKFDSLVLRLTAALSEHCIDAKLFDPVALRVILLELGRTLGPSTVAHVFGQAGCVCDNPHCPSTSTVVRCMLNATRNEWLDGGKWAHETNSLWAAARRSPNPVLLDELSKLGIGSNLQQRDNHPTKSSRQKQCRTKANIEELTKWISKATPKSDRRPRKNKSQAKPSTLKQLRDNDVDREVEEFARTLSLLKPAENKIQFDWIPLRNSNLPM